MVYILRRYRTTLVNLRSDVRQMIGRAHIDQRLCDCATSLPARRKTFKYLRGSHNSNGANGRSASGIPFVMLHRLRQPEECSVGSNDQVRFLGVLQSCMCMQRAWGRGFCLQSPDLTCCRQISSGSCSKRLGRAIKNYKLRYWTLMPVGKMSPSGLCLRGCLYAYCN